GGEKNVVVVGVDDRCIIGVEFHTCSAVVELAPAEILEPGFGALHAVQQPTCPVRMRHHRVLATCRTDEELATYEKASEDDSGPGTVRGSMYAWSFAPVDGQDTYAERITAYWSLAVHADRTYA